MASYTPEEIKGYAKSQGWLNDYGYLKDAQSLAAARSAANQFGVSVGDLESALGYNSGAIANYTQPVTQAATSGAQKTGPYSASDIKGYAQAQGWLNDQGKVKDDASAAAMYQAARQYGVSGTQIENALGYDSGVVNRYLATHGLGLLPGGMNGIGSTLGDSTQPGVPYQQSPAAAQVPGQAPIVFSPQSVNQSQTTQGILSQLLADGSPVMQRAKAIAMEDMAGRGLTSSSIATEAGMRALTDRAIDIAGRDSGIYAEQALQNQRGQYDAATGNANRDLQTQIFNANALNDAQKAQKEFEYRAELTKLSGALDAQSRAALQEAASKLQGNLNGQSMIVTATQRYTTMAQQIRIDPDLATEAKSSAIADLQHDWQAEVSRIAGIYGIALPADYFP